MAPRNRIEVPCATCGKVIERTPSQMTGANSYCSQSCAKAAITTKAEVICAACGKNFLRSPGRSKNKDRVYCSRKCGHAAQVTSESVACVTCGKKISRTKGDLAQNQNNYCSYACMGKAKQGKPSWNKSKIEVTCNGCGQLVAINKYSFTKHKTHYCSDACRKQYLNRRIEVPCDHCGKILTRTPYQLSVRKYNFCNYDCKNKWQVDQVAVSCTQCGTPFEMDRSIAERTPNHFCCKEHMSQWMSATFVGENHPQWQGGVAGYYGKNWKEQRRKARKRDGYKCQYCGLTEKKLGGELDVHHIAPFREFGIERYKEANHLSNLITLCRPCHRMAEYGKIPIQPKLL